MDQEITSQLEFSGIPDRFDEVAGKQRSQGWCLISDLNEWRENQVVSAWPTPSPLVPCFLGAPGKLYRSPELEKKASSESQWVKDSLRSLPVIRLFYSELKSLWIGTIFPFLLTHPVVPW
jgi:hypothetical protein